MNDEWMYTGMDEQRTGLVNDLRMNATAEKINSERPHATISPRYAELWWVSHGG